MTERGWSKTRTVRTVDTTGRQVEVTTGITTDERGHLVPAIAIGDGPTAVLNEAVRGQIALNMNFTSADVGDARHKQRGPR